MNRAFAAGTANQIAELARAGYFSTAVPVPPSTAALIDPADTTKDLTPRVRSYLDANCAQCHQPGGTAFGAWDARSTTPLSLTGIIDGPLIASAALPGDKVIVPGSELNSPPLPKAARTV